MSQNQERLEAVICQLLATVHAEKDARRKTLRQFVERVLDEHSFPSRDEMIKSYTFEALDLDVELPNLMSAVKKLPKPYGDMLCYIAYKDMHERMKMYQQLVDELCQQDNSTLLTAMPDADVVTA